MRALLSVYDKTGLVDLARGLSDLGFDLISSGGTSKALSDAGIAHREVSEVTGAPEMLGGRVKTLHPKVHGGILADRSVPSHLSDLAAQSIEPIDLVICNLYPFRSEPSIEMIDVGGPTMVRAAAKNHAHVGVVVDPAEYDAVLLELKDAGHLSDDTRRRLARAAFAHTASYDAAIVTWFDSNDTSESSDLPDTVHIALERAAELRYGENPHQHGARYRYVGGPRGFWDDVTQHGGTALSYLNLFDTEAAWRLAHELEELDPSQSSAVIVKHANACGAAISSDLVSAYTKAFDADPISAFGGIVALPGHLDEELAAAIVENRPPDVIIAQSIAEEAVRLIMAKRKATRLLSAPAPGHEQFALRQISGGFLVQEPDRFVSLRKSWTVATERQPDPTQWLDIELAWRVCARTSSNAIVLANNGQIVGVGCGQQNRVDAAAIATRKADGRAKGGVGASDAFFPFRDGLDAVADSGAMTVIQPGGSVRDDDVIAAANERGIALVLTGERHFRH